MYGLILRKILFRLEPERAHRFTMWMLRVLSKFNAVRWLLPPLADSPCEIMGLKFQNRVGIAAGLDKGRNLDALGQLGVGHIEVGCITPKPQAGNPQPRLFRLVKDEALINRMGFNNWGVEEFVKCVKNTRYQGVIGINVGKNRDTPLAEAIDDYVYVIERVYPYVSYVTINISSPNTPELRELQTPAYLKNLLMGLKNLQKRLKKYVPFVVKISPDLTDDELFVIANTLLEVGMDGVIATNTSLSREGVTDPILAKEQGGLSGRPLTQRSTEIVAKLSQILQHKIPIIAVGGIMSAEDAKAKFDAGAELVQVYTGLIYHGPALLSKIAALHKP